MANLDNETAAGEKTVVPSGTRSLVSAGLAVVAVIVVLALAWTASATLLLIFAGILLGVFLDGLTRGLGHVLPLPRALRLTVVSIAVAGFLLGMSAFGGATVAQQARDLGQTIQSQSGTVRDWLKDRGVDIGKLEALQGTGEAGKTKAAGDEEQKGGLGSIASGVLKSPGSLLSSAGNVLGPAAAVLLELFNALGNVLVIVFLGLSVAADPGTYRNGLVRFLPPRHRERGGEVLDGMGETLRHWLFGQLITMAVIFLCTWAGLAFLGIGGSLILGLQAGLLAFIPTVGPLVAGVIILLASLASGFNALLGALGVYLVVQTLESYGLTPFIQKRALDIPPATIFAGQLLLGVLFGLWGIALALPLMAVIKVLLEQLYIEETLGEQPEM
ncbi:AI-2E family transporter [Methylobacterium brachythecii]|uniref:AI-2E family transporter n=1 Tax=Methylobacterium brachythecii TaxID=1176177 RepID=A0A7W6AGN8_9HYPH|nr:AI-2E family transporter [Methylobacterium brachythecii]MBB3901976.1 putative PurR-regulated permease PerM [Methylobacterium brachythecii]GLS43358.1 AI-2E family transporter [Methylobacterium brachythecii]